MNVEGREKKPVIKIPSFESAQAIGIIPPRLNTYNSLLVIQFCSRDYFISRPSSQVFECRDVFVVFSFKETITMYLRNVCPLYA